MSRKLSAYLICHAKNIKLDMTKGFVSIGPYTIQRGWVFGAKNPGKAGDVWDVVHHIETVAGVFSDVSHSGVRSGHGHGRETLRFLNADGTLIYEASHIDHCGGAGYSCSYDHGPWYKYGEYKGSAQYRWNINV
jgi:hypothetical protein